MKTFHIEPDPLRADATHQLGNAPAAFGDYADHAPWSQRTRQVLSLKLRYLRADVKWAGCRALVLECESGLMADGLVRRGCEVTATESREYMLNLSRERSRSNGYLVHYRHVPNLDKLPFADEAFDLVLCDHVFERIQSLSEHLAEVSRVLKPEGILLYSTVNSSLRSRAFSNLGRDFFLPGFPRSLKSFKARRPSRMRYLLKSAGFKQGRMAGLRLRPSSVFGRPSYRISSGKPTIYLGSAQRP